MNPKPPALRLPPDALTRRRALACGVAGGALLTAPIHAASWLRDWLRSGDRNSAPGEVFKGDAPSDEVWRLWVARGWVREARHYLRLEPNVQCKVCPNNCLLTPGDRSHCRNKINRDGILYTLAYANPCTFHVDPIEKKPLFHYLPGTPTFSLATAGCVFRCLNCQNWEISQQKPEDTKDPRGPELRLRPPLPPTLTYADMRRLSLFPEDLAAVAVALRCPSVSYTYSEPTAYYEYAADCCRAARARGLRNILVTCGSIEERALRDLAASVDAAHVDLKGFSDDGYRRLNSGRLQPVLRTLKIYHELGVWFEVIHLVVPGYTDTREDLKRMCGWLVENLGPDRPLHFSRFHPQHKLEHLPPTPVETLLKARELARAAGLRHVYLGNVPGLPGAADTVCPHCRRVVIARSTYAVTRLELDAGRCRHCRQPIAGVWT
ncbi:MAG: AmmeMemoRadiSam system radical SAM enzyme [Verrucomicrobia bacterium]|nr:AmmeMemoRadiSam system radical SAM enzyme [Verrucomicrobiota bacterium]